MNKTKIYSFSVVVLLFSGLVNAQEKGKKENNIGTEVVDVVRPYEASISDAYKISDTPKVDDEYNTQKKKINYSINSFPVASTFVPEKGKAQEVDDDIPKPDYFNNYALLGAGNYVNVIGELFLSYNINETDIISGKFKRFSSLGGIKDLLIKDDFSKTSIEAGYGQKKENFNWNINLAGQHQLSRWYGLPVRDFDFYSFDPKKIDSEQIYRTIDLGGRIEFNKGACSFLETKYKGFSDDFQSKENRFFIKSNVLATIFDRNVDIDLLMDFVGTNYKLGDAKNNNSFKQFNFGIAPSIDFKDDWYYLKLGAALYINNSNINGNSTTFPYFYPKIHASFSLVENILISYVGAQGGLKQNSYADFVDVNPFISPANMIMPTSVSFDIYGGLKGKLDNNISYNVKGFYKRELEKPFFKTRSFKGDFEELAGYEYGNSFDVVYSNLYTLGLYGELRLDFEKYVSMGINGELNQYLTDLEEAWNMPVSKLGADIRVDINKDWYATAELFLVGERKDAASVENNMIFSEKLEFPVKTLKPYADFNVELGYRPTDRWTFYVNGKNLFNNKYMKWNNFKVQGIQFMAGAMYKFNFK